MTWLIAIGILSLTLAAYLYGRHTGYALGYQSGHMETLARMAWNTSQEAKEENLKAFDDAMETQ